jgi:hypothetical protein
MQLAGNRHNCRNARAFWIGGEGHAAKVSSPDGTLVMVRCEWAMGTIVELFKFKTRTPGREQGDSDTRCLRGNKRLT